VAGEWPGLHDGRGDRSGRGQRAASVPADGGGGRVGPGGVVARELRDSFVPLLSDDGVSLADIAPLVGHAGTSVTENVYRQKLRPVLFTGAVVMDRILGLAARLNG
jgi:integrase